MCWFWRWRFSCYIKRLQELEPAHSILLRWTNRHRGWENPPARTSDSPWTSRDKEYNGYWSSCNCARLQETGLLGPQAMWEYRWLRLLGACVLLKKPKTGKKRKSIGVLNWFGLVSGNMFSFFVFVCVWLVWQINLCNCSVSDTALCMLMSNLSRVQDVDLVHLNRVTVEGFEFALRACCNRLKKLKLLAPLRFLLSSELLEVLHARGCRIRWDWRQKNTRSFLALVDCCSHYNQWNLASNILMWIRILLSTLLSSYLTTLFV